MNTIDHYLRLGQRCRIRIKLCACKYTGWLDAVRVDQNNVLVTSPDPVWRHCRVNLRDAGLQVERVEEAVA